MFSLVKSPSHKTNKKSDQGKKLVNVGWIDILDVDYVQ